MKVFLKSGLALAALAGTMVAAASPADAQRYGRGYGGGGYYGRGYHNGSGAAIGAGILGLAVGAAIVGSARPSYGYYGGGSSYYGGGYGGGYGGYGGGYYAPPPPPRYVECRPVWDAYRDHYVRVCG